MCNEYWQRQRKTENQTDRARREAADAIEKAKQAKPTPERERRSDRREPATN